MKKEHNVIEIVTQTAKKMYKILTLRYVLVQAIERIVFHKELYDDIHDVENECDVLATPLKTLEKLYQLDFALNSDVKAERGL